MSIQGNGRSPLWEGLAGRSSAAGEAPWSVLNCGLFLLCTASAEEALRAIKTLRNDKAPLVKKRQVMRTLFGDYRKKMEEERCKQLKLMQAGRNTGHTGGNEEERTSLLPST